MRIGLIDVDSSNFPNLAIMKLSAWHKQNGDEVEWYSHFADRYDIVYKSKVFSFSPDFNEVINADKVVKGGTGYDIRLVNGREVFTPSAPLPKEVEHIMPDYSMASPILPTDSCQEDAREVAHFAMLPQRKERRPTRLPTYRSSGMVRRTLSYATLTSLLVLNMKTCCNNLQIARHGLT